MRPIADLYRLVTPVEYGGLIVMYSTGYPPPVAHTVHPLLVAVVAVEYHLMNPGDNLKHSNGLIPSSPVISVAPNQDSTWSEMDQYPLVSQHLFPWC